MCNGWATHCSHWLMAYQLIEDIGYDSIDIIKVKAHRKLSDALSDDDRFHIKGNGYADSLAKQGAKEHQHDEQKYASIKGAISLVKSVCKYIAVAALKLAKENQHERYERMPDHPKSVCCVSAPKHPIDSEWSVGARPRSWNFLSAKCIARSKVRAAKEVAEGRSEEAFQTWWRENRALRVTQSSSSVSGKERLAAVHARIVAKGCTVGRL